MRRRVKGPILCQHDSKELRDSPLAEVCVRESGEENAARQGQRHWRNSPPLSFSLSLSLSFSLSLSLYLSISLYLSLAFSVSCLNLWWNQC